MMDFPEEQVCLQAAHGPLKLDDVLFQAKKAGRLAPVQVVRADRVCGDLHVRAAATHMWRAMAEGRNQADKPEVEFTRYLAGKRTIKETLAHVGVTDETTTAVVVGFGPQRGKAVEYFIEMLGLQEADLPGATPETLRAFGITPEAVAATTDERVLDLVLEAVAGVDLARS